MIKRIALGQLRHLLSAAGGLGLGPWLLEQGQSVSDVETVISAALIIVSAVWSWFEKRKDDKNAKK